MRHDPEDCCGCDKIGVPLFETKKETYPYYSLDYFFVSFLILLTLLCLLGMIGMRIADIYKKIHENETEKKAEIEIIDDTLWKNNMSALLQKMKDDMFEAMKNKQEVRRDILRFIISESKTQEFRLAKPVTDEQVIKLISKTIESNLQSIIFLAEDPRQARLSEENVVLSSYLPKIISPEETLILLSGLDIIKSLNTEGQAIGEAIRFLKSKQISFDPKVVSEVVKQIRE